MSLRLSWYQKSFQEKGYDYKNLTVQAVGYATNEIFLGANPGLVVEGGANPLGAPTQYIYTFSE